MLTISGTALMRRYYDEIANQRGVRLRSSAADEILCTDFVFHSPNDVKGRLGVDAHKEWQIWHHGVAPGQVFTVEDLVENGVHGATRWTVRATHGGDFLGITAHGRPVEMTGVDYFHLRDGRISALWRSMDLRELVRQISAAD